MFLGGVLALTLAGGSGILAEAMDQSVRGSKDLLAAFEMAPVAIIPYIETQVDVARRRRRFALSAGIGTACRRGHRSAGHLEWIGLHFVIYRTVCQMSLVEEALARAHAQREQSGQSGKYRSPAPQTAAPIGWPAGVQSVTPFRPITARSTSRTSRPSILLRSRCSILILQALIRNRIVAHTATAPGVQAYKILRTRVLQRMRANGWRRLAISSLQPGEGKTLTALNLAMSIARDQNCKSVLVELDLKRPVVCRYLELSVARGIDSYLLGEASLEQVFYRTSIPGFFLAPAARSVENSSELLATSLSRSMVASAASIDPAATCLFDLPPLLQVDDLLVFAPLVDAVLLVVSEGQTARGELERVREFLSEFNLLGIVLNKSRERMQTYDYY